MELPNVRVALQVWLDEALGVCRWRCKVKDLETTDLQLAGYTEEYLERVNSVLQSSNITPMGAFCMGVVEAIARNGLGIMPDLTLLRAAASCERVSDAVAIAEKWLEETKWAMERGEKQ